MHDIRTGNNLDTKKESIIIVSRINFQQNCEADFFEKMAFASQTRRTLWISDLKKEKY